MRTFRMPSGRERGPLYMVLTVVAALLCLYAFYTNGMTQDAAVGTDADFSVHCIDVGQADAILLRQGEHAMLIDTGELTTADTLTGYLQAQGVDHLDYLVLTHPHADHIGGAESVFALCTVEQLFLSTAEDSSALYTSVLETAAAADTDIRQAVRGDAISLGDAQCTVLSPASGRVYEDANDASVVIRVTYGNKAFLFMGDAGQAAEDELLSAGFQIRADVLKAGHHGSARASGAAFLEAVQPSAVLLTVSALSPQHLPADETLVRLADCGAALYRTDADGTVVITIKNDLLEIQTTANRAAAAGN